MTTTLQNRVNELIERHGSIRAAAASLKVSHPYLYRLSTGELDNPGDGLLKKLGLRRVVTYVDINREQIVPSDEQITAWADAFILKNAFNRPIAVQIAMEAAKWVRNHQNDGT